MLNSVTYSDPCQMWLLRNRNKFYLSIGRIQHHHHAVSLCGEEISKGKLGSAIVTMDACNSEM